MQYIKGKLANLEDLLILIDLLKEKKGEVRLHLPYQSEEVSICFDGNSFYLSDRFKLIKLLEKWIATNIQPIFELFEEEGCSTNQEIEEEKLIEIIKNPTLKEVRRIPEVFEITKLETTNLPPFLVAHWKTKTPINREEIYKHGYTLSDLVKSLESGLLEIKAFKTTESLPFKLRLFLTSLAIICIVYLVLPINFTQFNRLKVEEAINWALREKVLGVEGKRELPVKGCFKTKFYLIDDKVINSGIDGIVGTADDKVIKLPKEGYKPTFAVPVK